MVLATSYRNIREKMKIVVTGGAGFIGSAFINHLLDNFECDVLCVDKLTYAGRRMNLKHNFLFYKKTFVM
jgi:dTDP-D-glucose 4,6-dehydratase